MLTMLSVMEETLSKVQVLQRQFILVQCLLILSAGPAFYFTIGTHLHMYIMCRQAVWADERILEVSVKEYNLFELCQSLTTEKRRSNQSLVQSSHNGVQRSYCQNTCFP